MSIMNYLPKGNTLVLLGAVGAVALIYLAHRLSRNYKKKRVLKHCAAMQANLTTEQAKKFFRFLKWYTLAGIKTPDIAWALLETQKKINASPDISGEYKRRIYRQLKRKRVVQAQEVVRYYVDKDGKRVY